MLGEVTVCSVVHVFVGRLIRRWRVADVGFDSDKHAQTRNDMKRGGESLGDSSEALGRLIDAQDPAYWSDEAGFQAMRTAIIACMKTESRLIGQQKTRFKKFDGDVEQAAKVFEAAETANADELAAILAGLDQGQAGSGQLNTPAPTPIGSSGPTASGGAGASTSASGSFASGSGTSGSAASGSGPTQNAPSAI